MIASVLFLACGSYDMEITATGFDFVPTTAFYGAAYITFIEEEVTCDKMWWVTTTNLDQEEAPTSDLLNVFQITYNSTDKEVLEGSFSVGGQSPVKGEYIVLDGEKQTVRRATEGILEVDEVVANESVSGSFNFNLPDASIQGTFAEIPWCINMK